MISFLPFQRMKIYKQKNPKERVECLIATPDKMKKLITLMFLTTALSAEIVQWERGNVSTNMYYGCTVIADAREWDNRRVTVCLFNTKDAIKKCKEGFGGRLPTFEEFEEIYRENLGDLQEATYKYYWVKKGNKYVVVSVDMVYPKVVGIPYASARCVW